MDKFFGIAAIVAVLAFFGGCAIYLKIREWRKLAAMDKKDRLDPPIDAFVSRYDCESVGNAHLPSQSHRCIVCGKALSEDLTN